MALVKFCLRETAGSPERARWLHLARSGSQSQRAIWFILPARGASHIIIYIIINKVQVQFKFKFRPYSIYDQNLSFSLYPTYGHTKNLIPYL